MINNSYMESAYRFTEGSMPVSYTHLVNDIPMRRRIQIAGGECGANPVAPLLSCPHPVSYTHLQECRHG